MPIGTPTGSVTVRAAVIAAERRTVRPAKALRLVVAEASVLRALMPFWIWLPPIAPSLTQ